MKKLIFVIVVSLSIISCNNQNNSVQSDKGWTFEKVNNVKNKGFKFQSEVPENSNKSDEHEGCTAPCCSEK